MRLFNCACGNRIFFDNHNCVVCDRVLAYDPVRHEMRSEFAVDAPRLCANRKGEIVCNWVALSGGDLCLSCATSQIIPSQHKEANRERWRKLESAKRRLIYGLMSLRLPVDPATLAFEFKEDHRTNPHVPDAHVTTGHRAGIITINAAEADDTFREQMRAEMNEPYRTLIGHMRHESGHYYFPMLVTGDLLSEARELFGDERNDYAMALSAYYSGGRDSADRESYISDYAMAHPAEDWAECWAHFLHLSALLETAEAEGLKKPARSDAWYPNVAELLINMNELTRSLGLPDAYPFVLSEPVIAKIDFVRRVVRAYSAR